MTQLVPAVPQDAWMHRLSGQYLPSVLQGGVADWPALTAWAGPSGLDTMRTIAGDARVQVMASTSSNFSGQLRDHGMQWVPLSSFLDACAAALSSPALSSMPAAPQSPADPCWYLAQCPMLRQATAAAWREGGRGLAALAQHTSMPAWLEHHVPSVDQVNLWMTTMPSSSSVHYDCFHNALCVVQGTKRVRLLAPSSAAAAHLPAVGLHTENPNHSQVAWTDEAWQQLQHTPGLCTMEATLQAGDVLLIPEGWWHQVASSAASIAVNLWWYSAAHAALSQPHMDAYFLRRCATTSLTHTREALLPSPAPLTEDAALRLLTQAATAAVQPNTPTPDVAAVLAALDASQCAHVLLRMAQRARVSLRALMLCGLTPAAAEVLTQRWDALGEGPEGDGRAPAFFDQLFAALGEEAEEVSNRLLEMKEAFGAQCMDTMIRVHLDARWNTATAHAGNPHM